MKRGEQRRRWSEPWYVLGMDEGVIGRAHRTKRDAVEAVAAAGVVRHVRRLSAGAYEVLWHYPDAPDDGGSAYVERADAALAGGWGWAINDLALDGHAKAARYLWDEGFRPMAAEQLAAGMRVVIYETDVFQLDVAPGAVPGYVTVHAVSHEDGTVIVRHSSYAAQMFTEVDELTEVWAK